MQCMGYCTGKLSAQPQTGSCVPYAKLCGRAQLFFKRDWLDDHALAGTAGPQPLPSLAFVTFWELTLCATSSRLPTTWQFLP
eukprot:1161525-Pelagomonas_calceolata.AAC.10